MALGSQSPPFDLYGDSFSEGDQISCTVRGLVCTRKKWTCSAKKSGLSSSCSPFLTSGVFSDDESSFSSSSGSQCDSTNESKLSKEAEESDRAVKGTGLDKNSGLSGIACSLKPIWDFVGVI